MRRTPLRRVSKRRAERLRQYGVLRAYFLQRSSLCDRCGKVPPTDVHHARGRFGSRLTNVHDWVALCRKCHDWVHRNPEEARKVGLMRDRIGNG